MGIREGLMLRDYVDNNARKQEEAKLRAQLYGAQAKHYDAQNQLLNIEVQKHQKYLESLAGALGGGQAQPAAQNLSGAFGGMQTEEQTPTFIGPPSSLSETPPTPGLSPQPGSAGPQAPGGISVAQLHNTQAFAAPDPNAPTRSEQLMQLHATALIESGLAKEGSQVAQAMLEVQKTRLALRTQSLQDKLGSLYSAQQEPMTDEMRMRNRIQIAATLGQLGKTQDAIDTVQGKLIPFQPGGGVLQALPGEAPKVVHESKYTPYTLSKERGAGAHAGAVEEGLRPPGSPPPTEAPAPRTRTRPTAVPPQTSSAPSSPEAEIAQLEKDLIQGGMSRADAKKYAPIFFYGQEANGGTTPLPSTPAAPPVSPAPATTPALGMDALAAAQKDQALRNQEFYGQPTPPARQPNATLEMVEKKKADIQRRAQRIPREATEQIGVPYGTTEGDVEDKKVVPEQPIPRQMPSPEAQKALAQYDSTIEAATELKTLIEQHPEHTALLGGFLANPAGAWKRLKTRAGFDSATPEQRQFLADFGVLAATARSRLIGLAQTSSEMKGLLDFLPDVSTSKEQLLASMNAAIKEATRGKKTLTGVQESVGVSTPGSRTPGAAPKAEAPKAAPAPKETREQEVERLLREQGLIK